MKINWKTRFKNGATLTGLVGAFIIFAKSITQSLGIDFTHQIDVASNIATAVISLLVGIGVVSNPNTKGVSDAGIDMKLNRPRNEDTHPVQFKSETNERVPKEYDVSEPLSDTSDEVVVDSATGGGSYEDLPEEEHDYSIDKALVGGNDEDSSTN
ncbi:phage holin [uncultured Staphylococcus sp.]|uniref:phage holin n=1 Tax=uncultured Staphylococcus sp. TaxID=189668 RepID=UPI0025DD6878|nr:phage holin [uncultured Staphylococcus sp.]